MYKIIEKKQLTPDTFEIRVQAPEIAKKAKAGQFLIIRLDKKGERIPLTMADWDDESVTFVVTVVGKTTKQLCELKNNNSILDICGPLGKPAEIQKNGIIVLIGGGCGTAAIFPEAKEYKKAGNKIISIIGARSKELLIWTERMEKISDELIITTDDGTAGMKGLVTDALKELIKREKIDEVIAIGPIIMMKFVNLTTKEHNIKTIVSLNPVMVDGIGMCGACRVTVNDETKFSCVDGPEFDGHKVGWDNLLLRSACYKEEEKDSCKCKK